MSTIDKLLLHVMNACSIFKFHMFYPSDLPIFFREIDARNEGNKSHILQLIGIEHAITLLEKKQQ